MGRVRGGIGLQGKGDQVRNGAPSAYRAKSAQMSGTLLDTAYYTLTAPHATLADRSIYNFDLH
jgi:hypothetical protein